MKLSEKLAALEAEEVQEGGPDPKPAPPRRGRVVHAGDRAGTSRPARDLASSWDESKRKVRDLVLADVTPRVQGLSGAGLTAEVKTALDSILQREDVRISPIERRKFVQEMIQDTLGYGPLDPLLQDITVSEIMCNAYDEIWVERMGVIEPVDAKFTNEGHYRHVIERIVSAVGRRVDESSPMVDARLPDGSRINAIIPPLAIHGPVLTIRKFSADPYTVRDLVNFGTFTADLAAFLDGCVHGRLNILVSGGTGTGKTTSLNVLSSFVPEGERIITIEDSAELQLQQPHVISLEARPPNSEGAGEIRIRDLVKNSLRMRPDRIIIGECRGAETLDMLQAMNTGHEGSMTTVHANSPRDALSRLETMALMAGFDLPVRAIREQIASALHLIIHLERKPDGHRIVTAVTEIQGMEGDTILLQDIFTVRPAPAGNGNAPAELAATGLRPKCVERLSDAGVDVPARLFQTRDPGSPANVLATRPERRGPAADGLAELAGTERPR